MTMSKFPSLHYEGDHPLTVEAYVTPRRNSNAEAIVHVAGSKGFLRLSRGSGSWFVYFRAGEREFYHEVPGVKVGSRAHLAAVWDGTRLQFYLDGKPAAGEAHPREVRPHDGTSVIGAGGTAAETAGQPFGFAGEVDEIRISKVARYKQPFTPPARFGPGPDTIALYHCDEGTGETLNDASGNRHHGRLRARCGQRGSPAGRLHRSRSI